VDTLAETKNVRSQGSRLLAIIRHCQILKLVSSLPVPRTRSDRQVNYGVDCGCRYEDHAGLNVRQCQERSESLCQGSEIRGTGFRSSAVECPRNPILTKQPKSRQFIGSEWRSWICGGAVESEDCHEVIDILYPCRKSRRAWLGEFIGMTDR
jgi:hypothetical protein